MRHDKSFTVKLASTFIVLLLLPIVTVSAEPTILVANFSTNVASGYSPFTVQFNDNTENATAWYWDFGDGSNSTEQSPIHTYSTVGNYTVTLTVSYTNAISKIITIVVSPQPILPVANFMTNATSGYVPLSIQFNDSSENATAWYWDFGDGSNSTEQNPMHTFYAAGNYSVNLVASNENGTDSKLATIAVQKSTPIINWNNPDDIIYGTALGSTQLNATASVPGSFDYTPATGTVLDIGVQTLHVDFTPDDAANYTLASKNVTITISAQSVLPVANFITNVTSGYAPLSVQFNSSSENATTWNWDFGDGSSSTEQNPIHTYPTTGTYLVNLTVSNTNGTSSTTSSINVIPPIFIPPVFPVSSFSSNVTSGYAPFTVQFNDSSLHAIGWNWDFGDGSNSTEQNPTHTFSAVGNYTVKLMVSNENGTDLSSSTIVVLPKKTESSNGTIEWGSSIRYDSGGPNSIVMDNSGHCVENHIGTGRLFYRVGNVTPTNDTINWGPSIRYDTGSSGTISMDNSGHCIEIHNGTGRLFYRVGTVNFDNNTINWGPSIRYDSGGPNSISMDDSGHCIEVHVGTARLFYRVGTVNFDNNTISWGPSIRYDSGGPNSISMDNSGHCIEAHVGTARLFYRVGTVNFDNNTISWGPSIRYDSGGPNSISLDDSGRCTEVHVGTGRLFYRVGTVNFANSTINWGPSIRYDSGGPNSISMDDSGHCTEAHVGTERLFYRVGKVNF